MHHGGDAAEALLAPCAKGGLDLGGLVYSERSNWSNVLKLRLMDSHLWIVLVFFWGLYIYIFINSASLSIRRLPAKCGEANTKATGDGFSPSQHSGFGCFGDGLWGFPRFTSVITPLD